MAEPTTINCGLIVANTGDLPGLWGSQALNPDFVAIDGYFGGVQPISISNANVTLTAPSGFTATPSPGPTQAQNAILRFTGAQTANIAVVLPLPGYYIIENLTTGNPGFVLQLHGVTATQVISIDKGMCQHVYNDGANVRFVNLGATGQMEFWAGYSALPSWAGACTIPPYILCDGGVYNFSIYPYLGARFGSSFGGDGVTTFGVPDLRGRVPLAYDATGARITAGVAGFNGQIMGAAGGDQNPQQHSHTFSGTTGTMNQNTTHAHPFTALQSSSGSGVGGGGSFGVSQTTNTQNTNIDHTHNFGGTTSNALSGGSGNVQPSQIAGIWVIRAA